MSRNIALVGLVILAIIGTAAILLEPRLVAKGEVEVATSRVMLFLGPIVAILVGIVTTDKKQTETQNAVADVQQKVDGHLTLLSGVVAEAAAAHPDVAELAAEKITTPPPPPIPDPLEGAQ